MTTRRVGVWLMWFSLAVAIAAGAYTAWAYTFAGAPQAHGGRAVRGAVGLVWLLPSILAAIAAGMVPFFLGVYLWSRDP